MDVKRIDRAIVNAKHLGYERLAIYALSEQMTFLRRRYGNIGAANIGVIPIDSIKNDIDYNIELFMAPNEQYVSKEGRRFDVSDITTDRKSRKQT